MKKFQQAVLGVAMLVLAGFASAQTQSAGDSSAQASKDPFVAARNEKADAKAELKSKKISKAEYKQAKKKARAKLKDTGVRSDTEKNQEVPAPSK